MGERGAILAIDPGSLRIGVAFAAADHSFALPLCTLQARDQARFMAELSALIRERAVTDIVVGLPLELDGSRGRAARSAERLAGRLERLMPCRVHLHDERMTSTIAERNLDDAAIRGDKRKEVVDQLAAQIILQSWLDANEGARP